MALAPRTTPDKQGGKKAGSTDSREGKADQRARNKEAGSVTRAGSSGSALAIAKAPKRVWEEVEHEVTHLTDIAGRISHSQVGSSGYLVATISTPLEFAHDLLDVHLKARDGLVYMRIYHVSLEDYLGDFLDMDELDPYALDGE